MNVFLSLFSGSSTVVRFHLEIYFHFAADYSGSLEAILDMLNEFKSDRIELEVANSGCGQISESDINLADAIDGLYFFTPTVYLFL